jgi:hypothetical protein
MRGRGDSVAGQAGRSGRKAEQGKPKLQPLNMRTDPDLRQLIEESAERTGRSLTQEVERRLRTSFIMDDQHGGQHVTAFVNMLGAVIGVVEARRGSRWIEDAETWETVRAATLRLLAWNRPASPEDDALFALGEASVEAYERLEAATKALDDFRNSRGIESKYGVAITRPTPVVRGGLFGRGPAAVEWVDPRAGWSDEDRKEERRLEAERDAANIAHQQASAPLQSLLAKQRERRATLNQLGKDEAEQWFSLIGPRRGALGA